MVGQSFSNAGEAMRYLKTRMVEQKAQELRRKLMKDHQLIHDRKKLDPCISFLPGHDQKEWFAKLDANGIWAWVLAFLTSPSDITSAYYACETFRKHLEEKRRFMFLPKLFAILRGTGHLRYVDGRIDESRDVLNQRLVSKAWKKAAEERFLVPPSLSQFSNAMWGWMASPIKCFFRSVKDIDSALEKLVNIGSCASLLRAVMVDEMNMECGDLENFYSKLAQFLDMHGEAVWGLFFLQNGIHSTRTFNYDGLHQLVSRMPNLKALNVDLGWQFTDDLFLPPEVDSLSRRKFHEACVVLLGKIAQHPFPTLPQLEQLTVLSLPGQIEAFVADVIQRNQTLKAVRLGPWDPFGLNNVIPDSVWDAMGSLRLETFDEQCLSNSEIRFDDFRRLKDFDWPLKFLRLNYSCLGRNEDDRFEIGASDILEVLNKFNHSLVEFSFEGKHVEIRSGRGNVVVDLPNLKKFTCADIL